MNVTMELKDILKNVIRLLPNSAFACNYDESDFEDCTGRESEFIEEALESFESGNEGLRLCGCGSPEDASLFIYKVLLAQNKEDYDERKTAYSNIFNISPEENYTVNGAFQFILYVLNERGFLEHGTSVYSSWLTAKGKCYLSLLELSFKEDGTM